MRSFPSPLVAYVGPGLAGRETNLRRVLQHYDCMIEAYDRREAQEVITPAGLVHVITTPGAQNPSASLNALLPHVDVHIFVADSQRRVSRRTSSRLSSSTIRPKQERLANEVSAIVVGHPIGNLKTSWRDVRELHA